MKTAISRISAPQITAATYKGAATVAKADGLYPGNTHIHTQIQTTSMLSILGCLHVSAYNVCISAYCHIKAQNVPEFSVSRVLIVALRAIVKTHAV